MRPSGDPSPAEPSAEVPSPGSSWFADPEALLGELRAARAALAPPAVPGYQDLVEHGRGGQGVVFTALQCSTRRRVAIKLLLHGAFADASRRLRLQREAALAATLQHDHIVRVHDTGTTPEGWPYLVMELAEGVTLEEWAAAHPEPRTVVAMFVKIAGALAHAHQRGVIHRDLKPSNVRIDARGEPRLLDFGLARALAEEPGTPSLSHSGELLGSLPWTSPEQAAGNSADADVRSDVYSFGVVLYHALTGTFPYPVTGGLRAVLAAIQEQPPLPPSRHAQIDPDLDLIVLGCLAKDPARRYQSADAVAADLGRWLREDPIAARADSTWYVLRMHLRRHRGKVASALLAAAALLASAVVATVLWRRAASAEALATQRLAETQWVNGFLARLLGGAHPDRGGRDRRVVDLLTEAGSELKGRAGLPPRAEAAACQALGSSYLGLGLHAEAEPWLARAVELRSSCEGPSAPATLESLTVTAELRREQGRLDDALAIVRAALARAAPELGGTHAAVLALRRADANLRLLQGRSADAVAELRVLAEQMRACGAPRELLAATLGDLGLALQHESRFPEALAAFRDALACEPGGECSMQHLTLRDDCAQLLVRMGDAAGAERELRAVLAAREDLLGPQHAYTLVSCGTLAGALCASGKDADAEPLLRRALSGLTAAHGSEHPFTLAARQNLAVLLQRLGRRAEAAAELAAVLEVRGRVQGLRHPDTLKTEDALAVAEWSAGFRERALARGRRTVAAMREVLGEGHHDTAVATGNLAMHLHHAGHVEEACDLFRRAMQASAQAHGAAHFEVALQRRELAQCLFDLQRLEEAARELAEAERVLTANFPTDHVEVRRCHDLHAKIEVATRERAGGIGPRR